MLDNYLALQAAHPRLFDNSGAPLEIVSDPTQVYLFEQNYRRVLSAKQLPQEWARIGIVLDDPYIVVLRDLVRFPDSTLKPYVRLINKADLHGGQGVVIFPLLRGEVLLLRQFRHATRSWHLEVPRGFGTPGVSAEDNAHKEMREEANATVDALFDLGPCHSNTGMEGSTVQLFLAHLSSVGAPAQAEGIERVSLVTVSKLEAMIEKAEITDAFTISAYARAKLRGLL
jgi:ADP-ribose pyrophosphatase